MVDGEIKQFSCKMDVPLRLWDVKINLAVDRIGNPLVEAGRYGEKYLRSYLSAASPKGFSKKP